MKKRIITAMAIVAVAMMAVSAIAIPVDADGDSSFTITYTLKNKTYNVNFDGPTDKVVVFGYAAALTVLDTGKVSKLYACDKYGDDAFAEKGLTRGDCKLIPNLSSTNVEAICSQLIQAVDSGDFSKNDTIILTTMSAAADSVRKKLTDDLGENGFKHVIFYGTMESYSDIIKCVKEIEQIVGSEKNLYKHMQSICDEVKEKVGSAEKKDALFVWYSPTDGWGYGNKGSLSVSMINEGGGNNLGYNESSSSSIIYDKSAVVQKMNDSPECVIFLDSGYLRSYEGTIDKFVEEVMGGDMGKHTICIVEHAWNNYCPESADGLKAMASVMHPDLIKSDVDVRTYKNVEKQDNTILYVVIGVVSVLVVGVGIVLILKRR